MKNSRKAARKSWFVFSCRSWRLRLAAAALALLAGAALWSVPRRMEPAGPSPELLNAARGLDEIRIDAGLDEAQRSLSVKQTLRLTNRTGQKQEAAVLRTWANAFQSMDTSPCAAEEKRMELCYPAGFSSGALVMARAQANGETVLYRYTDDARTVLKVPVPGGWAADESIEIHLEYTVQLPQAAYRFGVWNGIWAVGNAFAIPAVWENGAFRTDPYTAVGDPFVSDCANYSVTVSVPKGYVCAGCAEPKLEKDAEEWRYIFTADAVRDFALVISEQFRKAQAVQDGILVTAYAADASRAGNLLRLGQKALSAFGELYGAYPYPAFTLAETAMADGGMEYPALCMISSDLLAAGGRELEYAVAHETAHQWWYAAVGTDSWNQPWQDEALCEFSVLEYAEKYYGYSERENLERSRMESALRVTVPQGITPGSPLGWFSTAAEYRLVVYDRGAACICALDRTVPLDSFLRDYYRNYAFLRASREDFEQQLFASTGEDLIPLMRDYLDTSILN